MPLPLVPLVLGKVAVAGAIALYGHRFARGLQKPTDYTHLEPAFVPAVHLEGFWKGEGVLQGPLGKVGARLQGTLWGEWTNGQGRLMIRVASDTGPTWEETLQVTDAGTELTLLDGTGKGTWAGNSLHLARSLTLPDAMGGWALHSDDWFHVLPSGAITQRSAWSKWGVPVGDLSMQWARAV